MATVQELLIAGYVKGIESILHGRIIPVSINKIVFEYYFAELLLIYIAKDLAKPWYIADIESNGEKIWQSVSQGTGPQMNGGFTKPCVGYNIQLSSNIKHINAGCVGLNTNKIYHGIFHCGGYIRGKSALCSVLLFDSTDPPTLSTEHQHGLFVTNNLLCITSFLCAVPVFV